MVLKKNFGVLVGAVVILEGQKILGTEIETRNSKPSSAVVFGHFSSKFFDFFSCTFPMAFAAHILGFSASKGVF